MMQMLSRVVWLACAVFFSALGVVLDAWAGGITVLKSDHAAFYNHAMKGVEDALSPSTSVIEYTLSEHISEARRTGQDVRASSPDLVIAIGLRAALIAKFEIPDVPTIFCLVLFPEAYGLPMANMIGLSMQVSVEEQVRAIRSIAPHTKRIGLIHSADTPLEFLRDSQRSVRQQGMNLFPIQISGDRRISDAVKELKDIDLLWILPDPMVVREESMELLMSYSFESHIPVFTFSPALVRHGAVGAIYLDPQEVGFRAGRLALQMLKGYELPNLGMILPGGEPHLAVNIRSAAHFGLRLSWRILEAARERFGADSLAKQHSPPVGP